MVEGVLIATLGYEPQVATLTLNALQVAGFRVQYVTVLHTDPTHDAHTQHALNTLRDAFQRTPRYSDIYYTPHLLSGRDGPLPDVISPQDMQSSFEHLYTLLRQQKQAGRQVHLAISGGRKTLALMALSAAQVHLDADDRVWQLTSDDALMQSKALHASDPTQVQLVRIPLFTLGQVQYGSDSRVQRFMMELTNAEQEIVRLIMQEGLSNQALADRLQKSEKTIANQLTGIYRKAATYYELERPVDRVFLMSLLGRYSQTI
jgi:CRISPR-associated protein Csx14